jgi:hypothetical protein
MTSGMTPKAAYFARITSTRTDGGMAGKGSAEISTISISADRSFPFTTSLPTPPSPGCVSTSVATPSMIASARPLIVTISTTRISGTPPPPPVMRKSVRSGDRAGRSKVSSNPPCVSPDPSSTFAALNASIAWCGAGMGTGPISNESLMPPIMCVSERPTRQPILAAGAPRYGGLALS